jgi:hypothetical protein
MHGFAQIGSSVSPMNIASRKHAGLWFFATFTLLLMLSLAPPGGAGTSPREAMIRDAIVSFNMLSVLAGSMGFAVGAAMSTQGLTRAHAIACGLGSWALVLAARHSPGFPASDFLATPVTAFAVCAFLSLLVGFIRAPD